MHFHWAYHSPAYRCRHGHTSARGDTPARPKILYVREDHLLARISHDAPLHRQHPELRDAAPADIAAYLDDEHMIIVGDHQTWAIETETNRIELAPLASLRTISVSPPTQRQSGMKVR